MNLGQVRILGGSWGATLGLAYAEAYPDHVAGVILRGILTGAAAECDYHYRGAQQYCPVEYEELRQALPDPARGPRPEYLLELLQSEDVNERLHWLDALGCYELKVGRLRVTDEEVQNILAAFPADQLLQISRIDLHYSAQHYFLEEGQLLRDAVRLRDIPVVLINGRYDVICPLGTAFGLHRMLPRSRLVIVEEAGHSEGEPGTTAALLEAVATFE